MALAIIEFAEEGRSGPRFRIDIGTNGYYSYAIGGKESSRQNGIEMLLDPVFTSPVLGPLPPSTRGRTVIEVPARQLDKEHRRIQLASFRTKDRVGPAISAVVSVSATRPALDDLPPPALFTEPRGIAAALTHSADREPGTKMTTRAENVPYSYQRSQVYSSAMFLQAITSLLPQLLPAVGPLLGGLFGGKNGGGTSQAENLLAKLGNPETVKLVTDLIKQISSAKALGATVGYREQGTQQAAAMALTRYRHEFSEAKVAPALLAALPALMPIIEKVLNPETMKAIMENVSPAKLVGAVSESVANFAKIGLEGDKQLQEHLERLNPGVKNPELYKLLEGLSTGEARAGSKLRYKRVDTVKLQLAETTSQTLYGRSRLAYRYGQNLSFPLDVETPKRIGGGVLEISLKESATLRIVYEKQHKIGEIASGPLDMVPTIPWSALSKVRAGDDYMLTLAVCWAGSKGGPKRGTALSQLITLVSEYAFDRVEESAPEMVPLKDANRDREFWHRIWDQTFQERGLTRLRLSCEYCYVLDGERQNNARMETKLRVEKGNETTRTEGQLKSGMILSPDTLNKLVTRISAGADGPLPEAQLDALRTPDFLDRFNQLAKTQVDFKGRRGESAALWVYPEMKLREVVLKKIGVVNPNGHVQSFEEAVVRFPMPAMVHFVGTGSSPARGETFGRGFESDSEGAQLDDLNVIFDQKVGLYPANLEKKAGRPVRQVPARAAGLPRIRRSYVH